MSILEEEKRQIETLKAILERHGWIVREKDVVDYLEIVNEFNRKMGGEE